MSENKIFRRKIMFNFLQTVFTLSTYFSTEKTVFNAVGLTFFGKIVENSAEKFEFSGFSTRFKPLSTWKMLNNNPINLQIVKGKNVIF